MTPRPPPFLARRLPWFGGVIAAGVVVAAGCTVLDRLAVLDRQALATVTVKEHRAPGRTYTTMTINNRPHVVPQATGEQWLVGLAFADTGTAAVAPVGEGLFARLAEGQSVTVTYRQGRLFGGVEVLAVEP
jgi:hypothetical protein